MLCTLNRTLNAVLRNVERWGTTEWTLALAVMVVIALVLLRGYGSRSQY